MSAEEAIAAMLGPTSARDALEALADAGLVVVEPIDGDRAARDTAIAKGAIVGWSR